MFDELAGPNREPYRSRRELSQAADMATLGGVGVAGAVTTANLLAGSTGNDTAWRVMEISTDEGLPFEVEVRWTGASGGGRRALFTVTGGAARICMAATGIQNVKVTNLANVQQTVRVAIATSDSATTTQNHWMQSAIGGGPGENLPIEIIPPPYAQYLRVDPSDPAALAGSSVELYDGLNQLCVKYALNAQPDAQPIAGIRRVLLNVVAHIRYRIDFTLEV